MSLRSEARELEKAMQMSKAGTPSQSSTAVALGKENVPAGTASTGFAPPPGPLYRCETERSASGDPFGTGTSRTSSVSPSFRPSSTGLDAISTPPPAFSSSPTTAHASSASFYGAPPQPPKDGVRLSSARQAASSPLKEMLVAASKPRQYTSAGAKKWDRAARIGDSEDEDDHAGTSSRDASVELAIATPSVSSVKGGEGFSSANRTQIFVELPASTTKRSRTDLFDVSPEPSSSPPKRGRSDGGRTIPPDSSGSWKRRHSTEADDAAFAAALAMQGEGVATRRASRNTTKSVSYAPACDKDGRPIKSSSAASASSTKNARTNEAERAKRTENKVAEPAPTTSGQAKPKKDRTSKIRDENETDEDWQSSHSLDSPARQRSPSAKDLEAQASSKATPPASKNVSKRLQEVTSMRAEAEGPPEASAAAFVAPTSDPIAAINIVPEDGEPTVRKSKRQSDKLQREEEAEAARRKAREERKRREAEEREKAEAEAAVPPRASNKDGRKETKTAIEAKTFDLSTSPTRTSKAKQRSLGIEDEAPSADEATATAGEELPQQIKSPRKNKSPSSATGGRGRQQRVIESEEPPISEKPTSARVQANDQEATAAKEPEAVEEQAQEDRKDQEAVQAAPDAATISSEPATPMKIEIKGKEAVVSTTAPVQQRASTSVRPQPSAVQTPTVSIAHRSNSTPSSTSRASTPSSSSFMGKSLSTLLTPGASRYGAVRRPGLTRKTNIPSLLNKRGPLPPPRPPAPPKKKKKGDEDDYEYDEAYERLMGRLKDEEGSDAEREDETEEVGEEPLEEALDEVVDDY